MIPNTIGKNLAFFGKPIILSLNFTVEKKESFGFYKEALRNFVIISCIFESKQDGKFFFGI